MRRPRTVFGPRIGQHWRRVMATKFVTSADGTRIAYETMGQGAPLVFVWGALRGRARRVRPCDALHAVLEGRGGGRAHAALRRRRHGRVRVPRKTAARDPRAYGGPRGR